MTTAEPPDADRPQPPVVRTPDELAQALAELFVDNALAGRDDVNDDLVAEIIAWQRSRKR